MGRVNCRATIVGAIIFASVFVAVQSSQAGTSIPTTRPAIAMASAEYAREVGHLDRVMKKLDGHPELAGNEYVKLQLAVARRFLERLRAPSSTMLQQAIWAKPQM